MTSSTRSPIAIRKRSVGVICLLISVLAIAASLSLAHDKTQFPDGFDAVEAAPNSHKVLFENAFVRVLEVWTPIGTREPMHHHRWPSIFLTFDAGGRTPHGRYHRPDGTFREVPSTTSPILDPPVWRVRWMEPEPMHSIENLETPESAATISKRPHFLRVEFKTHP